MSGNENDGTGFTLKVVLVGETGAGKSCLLLRFADNCFTQSHMPTIGVDFKVKQMRLDDGREVNLQVWDTAGQERFRTVATSFYRGAHGVLVVFDLTDRKSFDKVKYWVSEIKSNAPETVAVVLVGNKCDLLRAVDTEEGTAVADSLELPYFETSAKTGKAVQETYAELTRLMIQKNFDADSAVQVANKPKGIAVERQSNQSNNGKCPC